MYVPFEETDHEAILNNLEESSTGNNNQSTNKIDIINSQTNSAAVSKLMSKKKKSACKENQKTKEKMMEIRKRMKENKQTHLLKEINNPTIRFIQTQYFRNTFSFSKIKTF